MRPFAAGVCWWAVCGPGASGPFLQSSECPWNSLCHGVPLSPALGMQTRALTIILPQGSTEGERKDLWVWKWKQYSVSGTSVVGELESGGFVCLFSPRDFHVLSCRSSAVTPVSSPSIPTALSVGGFFPAMINYSLSESKSAFSSLIICDEFILLTWAWIEAIEDNKLTLSILMTSLDYGWIKE